MPLLISTALLAEIRAHAHAAKPHECCGLLLGDPKTGMVASAVPAPNISPRPEHAFEIDPTVLLATHRAARSGEPAILGHYHSHPATDSRPSQTDAALAQRGGEIWLIVGGDGSAQAWRADRSGTLHGCFNPVEIIHPADRDLAPQGPQGH